MKLEFRMQRETKRRTKQQTRQVKHNYAINKIKYYEFLFRQAKKNIQNNKKNKNENRVG